MVRPVVLRGGRILDPSQSLDAVGDVVLIDGKVDHAGPRTGVPDGAEVVDCDGCIVSPGFIDVHCHLREPGREDVETIATGARAAAAGGFTAVCAMPNTDPVTDNQAAVGFVVRQGLAAAAARVYPIGAISVRQKGEALAEVGEMVGAGAVAISDDGKPVVSAHLMRTALEYARTFGIPVVDHCEEPSLAVGGAMNEGRVSARLGLRGVPSEAEEIMAIRDILLSRRTGGHVHLAHMSTRGSVELIRWGKERGIAVTAEVCPHHLSLTEEAVDGYNTNAKMNPPLRTADDVAALREALRDGTIDVVATDHAPHHYDEKEREFADAPNGIVGLETALAVVVTNLVGGGYLDYAALVDRMSVAPARIFHLPGGSLLRGKPADVTVFDPDREWTVDPTKFLSKGRNSPYAGHRLRGWPSAPLSGVESSIILARKRVDCFKDGLVMASLTIDKPQAALAALLQERQRYEQWLAVLDSRRSTTPPHVYTRVRSDYEGRLNRVIDDLGGRTAELQQVVDALAGQVATLQGEENAKRDLQAEAELRAAVGEYSPDQWREVSQASEADLTRITAQRADAASELAQVQQLLNMATGPRPTAAPPAPIATSAPPPPPPAALPTAPRAPRPGEPATGGRSAARPDRTNFDELAFLNSVVEPKAAAAGGLPPSTVREPPTRPPVMPPPSAPPPPTRPRTPPLPSAAVPPAAAAPAVPPQAKPAAPAPAARPVTPPEAALVNTTILPGPAPESSRRGPLDSESVPVFLRDVPSEQVKTLKCAECGTMNYPTEWYCERCGGELAAM